MMLSFLIISAIKADSGCTVSDDLVVTGDLSFDGELKPDGSTCSNGQILKKTGTDNWDCADDDTGGGGDITSVIAGTGLSDGGTSGDVTLNADTSYLQRRVSSTCTAGSSIREIKEDGTVTCETDDTGGKYCYTYYSESLDSCTCPDGETNKKDLGAWGICYYSYVSIKYYDFTFRPPGTSCPPAWAPGLGHTEDVGLACVCCEN